MSKHKISEPILITGGSGFIGQHLVSALQQYDFLSLGRTQANIIADLTKPEDLQQLRKTQIKTVIHLASLIPKSQKYDKEYHESNYVGTKNLFHALPSGCSRFVYISTGDVYGEPVKVPISEEHQTKPLTDYASSKLESEDFLKTACRQAGISLAILRLSHIYGPGEPVVKAIPTFITTLLNNKQPVLDSPLSARDYLYVTDVVDAILLAAASEKEGVYNIASGKPITIKEVLEKITSHLKSTIQPKISSSKPPKIIYYSINAAQEQLRFKPKVELTEGLKNEIEWFKQAHKVF